jgi:hypothetical protein
MRHRTIFSTESRRREYVDDLVDDYVSWREACAAVDETYENWRRAGRQDRALAFADYVAALNCEERAAIVYQQAVEGAGHLTTRESPVIWGTAGDA